MLKPSIFATLFIAAQAINTPATALNKCLINGQINYQDTDCPKGTDQAPKPQTKPAAALNLSDASQRKALLEKIEKDLAQELKTTKNRPTPTPQATRTEPPEQSIPMPFDQCIASVNRTLDTLPMQRRNASHIIDSGQITLTKICTSDGTVLIACSKAEQTMLISRTTSSC